MFGYLLDIACFDYRKSPRTEFIYIRMEKIRME
jgi:hypothetical protein